MSSFISNDNNKDRSYALLPINEKGEYNDPVTLNTYPCDRRSSSILNKFVGPPSGSVFMKTGGNALQAVPKKTFEEHDDIVAVTVPNLVIPGDIMLVIAPDGSGRLISVKCPENTHAGRVFFVKFPKLQHDANSKFSNSGKDSSGSTPVVMGYEVTNFDHNDLTLQVEQEGANVEENKELPLHRGQMS